jgi:hypothetical protein
MLGKLAPEIDKRTIALKAILNKDLPPLPSKFSIWANPLTPAPQMLGNNQYSDCVEVAITNQQIADEVNYGQTVIPVTTANVLAFYHKIAGPGDPGTVYLNAMKYWQKYGLVVGQNQFCKKGNTTTYKIDAFASVAWQNVAEVKQAIMLLNGLQVGVQLPQSAEDQYKAGQPWTIISGSPIIGGHGLCFGSWDDSAGMFECLTWGKRQLVAYDWFAKYPDEAYASVDDMNEKQSVINVPTLEAILKEITS